MSWRQRILTDPKIMVGKSAIKGTRITVEWIMQLLADGVSHEGILESYPHLTESDIMAAQQYAAEVLKTGPRD